jgi:predicted AAA+ superfamily ATPase
LVATIPQLPSFWSVFVWSKWLILYICILLMVIDEVSQVPLLDLGLGRLAAKEQPTLPQNYLGSLFEQFIGLERVRWSRLQSLKTTVRFWRDSAGPEVGWILDSGQPLLHIEVKWTDNSSTGDAKHLELFMKSYPNATRSYVVCRVTQPQQLSENIVALSWRDLLEELGSKPLI